MTIATTEPSTHRSRYRSRRDPHPVVVDRTICVENTELADLRACVHNDARHDH